MCHDPRREVASPTGTGLEAWEAPWLHGPRRLAASKYWVLLAPLAQPNDSIMELQEHHGK